MLADAIITLGVFAVIGLVGYGVIKLVGEKNWLKLADKLGF